MSSNLRISFFAASKTVMMFRECWGKWDPLRVVIIVLKVYFYQKRDKRIRLKLYLLLLQSVNDKVGCRM